MGQLHQNFNTFLVKCVLAVEFIYLHWEVEVVMLEAASESLAENEEEKLLARIPALSSKK